MFAKPQPIFEATAQVWHGAIIYVYEIGLIEENVSFAGSISGPEVVYLGLHS